MKRFISAIALVAFLAALAVPVLAQSSTPSPAPAPAPATESPKTEKAENGMKAEKSARHAKAEKAENATMAKIDINSATKEELMKLPGVGDAIADKIIAGRPYKTKAELTSKKIVGPKAYSKIRAKVIATQPAAAK